ncbi:MAG: trypsin-like serine protease [Streptosporangiaceae bacterium]
MTISQTIRGQEADEGEQRAPAEDDEGASDASKSGQAVPEAWRNKRFRISVLAAAMILAAGVGFGGGRAIGLGDTVILAGIPRPATVNTAFIEDDDETGQDNQANILSSTALGMVHILSDGTSVGIGLVLTESGKVLTTYRPSAGAANLAAEYVVSRITFKARVIGTDAAAGLALLQLEGGHGKPFSTVEAGNSATLVKSTEASRQSSYHVPGEVYDTAVGTTGRQTALTMDVGTLVTLDTTVDVGSTSRGGLMASVLQSAAPSVLGGPLVNLNGQVIGIIVGGSGSGLDVVGYAIPINTALSVATQIECANSLTIRFRLRPIA